MKYLLQIALFCSFGTAQDRLVDTAFITLSALNTSAVMFDAVTTTWIRPRWEAAAREPVQPCMREGGMPWLYGEEPTKLRTYSVAAGELAITESLAVFLKHKRKRLWYLPLMVFIPSHAFGMERNFRWCR